MDEHLSLYLLSHWSNATIGFCRSEALFPSAQSIFLLYWIGSSFVTRVLRAILLETPVLSFLSCFRRRLFFYGTRKKIVSVWTREQGVLVYIPPVWKLRICIAASVWRMFLRPPHRSSFLANDAQKGLFVNNVCIRMQRTTASVAPSASGLPQYLLPMWRHTQ